MTTLVWVDTSGVSQRSDQNLPEELGEKAAGLLRIPSAWTPSFLAVSPRLLREYAEAESDERAAVVARWFKLIKTALGKAGIRPEKALIIRSNAVGERLQDRGSFSSRQSQPGDLVSNLQNLLAELLPLAEDMDIGLIIQDLVEPILKGHLSNERRVAKEYRDAEILSIVVETGEMNERKIVHRNWRRSDPADEGTLSCESVDEIKDVLREPLVFAAQNGKRVHYEWVWDGRVVHIVQADHAPDEVSGKSPEEMLGSITPPPTDLQLESFRAASREDAQSVGKLQTHIRYRTQGFWQPAFYLMDDPKALLSILNGSVPEHVEGDLARLMGAPLVIRTAYAQRSVALLPRSPLLTSLEGARDWLIGKFAEKIREKEIELDALTLLSHHYIPALAAAFSNASPHQSGVVIESLWGIPEGLYYYPCDEYLVSTPISLPSDADDFSRFSVKSRVRFKSHFVAPDSHGRFCRFRVRQPWDWKPTIRSETILYRMARFTRKVAQEEGRAVNIMWFLGCRTPDGEQETIPWYQEMHEDLESYTDFHQNARDEVIIISTEADLRDLEARSEQSDTGRLIVKLSPSEDIALRDESFARRVGEAAAHLGAIIMLNGARLAHIYYVLKKTRAEVVTRAIGEEVGVHASYRKLVRDKIPEKVVEGGESVRVANLSPRERLLALKVKLIEEAFEVRDAQSDKIVEELADVQEVLRALVQAAGLAPEDVEAVRIQKAEARGGFEEGVQLLETGPPIDRPAPPPLLDNEVEPTTDLVRTGKARPFERMRPGGSDRRQGGEFVEIVRDLSVSLSHRSWRHTLGPIEFGDVNSDVVTVSIQAHREGADLRFRIKLRIGEEQFELSLPLPEEIEGEDYVKE